MEVLFQFQPSMATQCNFTTGRSGRSRTLVEILLYKHHLPSRNIDVIQAILFFVSNLLDERVAMNNTCDDSPPCSSEQLNVVTWLCRDSVFNDFFCDHPDNVAHRKLLFEILQTYLEGGHDLVLVLAQDDIKNDLIWDFRRRVVKNIGTEAAALNELEFTTNIINKDATNGHAWSHRQWVFQTFGRDWGDEDELAYCAKILEDDTYNCFAWDQRCFVVTRWVSKIYEAKRNMHADPVQFEKVVKLEERYERKKSKEAEYALKVIRAEPENQYPWSHMKTLYDSYPGLSLCAHSLVRGAILRVLEDERDCVRGLKVGNILDERVAFSMNAKGVINALNMILDFLVNGCFNIFIVEEQGEGKMFRDVINELCPDSCLLHLDHDFEFLDKVLFVLQRMEETLSNCGLSWRNAGDELLYRGYILP